MRIVGPDLDRNCLQKFSADQIGKIRVNKIKYKVLTFLLLGTLQIMIRLKKYTSSPCAGQTALLKAFFLCINFVSKCQMLQEKT